jgi:hypothetical protein
MAGLTSLATPNYRKRDEFNLPDLPSLLNTNPEQLQDMLSRIQLNARGGVNDYGLSYGGRVGGNIPLSNDSSLNAGVSGYGYDDKVVPTGLDVAYNFGKNTVGGNYKENNYVEGLDPRTFLDTGKLLQLFYSRQF